MGLFSALFPIPECGDEVEGIYVRFDVGAVDQPQILYAALIGILQFLFHKFHGIGNHRQHISRLKIIEGDVIVNSMTAVFKPLFRKGLHSWVMVPLSS